MTVFKRHPIYTTILLMLGLAIPAEIALLTGRQRSGRRVQSLLADKEMEREAISRLTPSPTEASARALEADVGKAREVLAGLRQAMQDQNEAAQFLHVPLPATRLDAYLEISAFVDQTRARADQAMVTVNPDERFGFATHAHEGPTDDCLGSVIRQCRIMQRLVEMLIDAQPHALLAAQREPPLTAGQRTARRQTPASTSRPKPVATASSGDRRDFFTWDEKMSVRSAGCIDTEAFRLQFAGPTSVLRVFLNTLAAGKIPLWVRSVEVEPFAVASVPAAESSGRDSAPGFPPVPQRQAAISKFTLIIEYAELISPRESGGVAAINP
ncbi:MAG: Amuc_1100 family pilus-like protein [Opitutaceae bacterium]|nr:Amuc_1100 family pilus-like protein [Opitutaceae bacterium]